MIKVLLLGIFNKYLPVQKTHDPSSMHVRPWTIMLQIMFNEILSSTPLEKGHDFQPKTLSHISLRYGTLSMGGNSFERPPDWSMTIATT